MFCICEFSGNVILAEATNYNNELELAYQTWAISDFFLLIGAVLLFIECGPVYILNDANQKKKLFHCPNQKSTLQLQQQIYPAISKTFESPQNS